MICLKQDADIQCTKFLKLFIDTPVHTSAILKEGKIKVKKIGKTKSKNRRRLLFDL